MKEKDKRAIQKIIAREMSKDRATNKARFDAMDKRMGIMQWQIDVLYGADPVELQTKARSEWKGYMTKRVSRIRENHPDEAVRNDYRVMFGHLYKTMQADYGIDLGIEKSAYMQRHDIPMTASKNVRALNIVYDSKRLRDYFEAIVEKYEGWYCPEVLGSVNEEKRIG